MAQSLLDAKERVCQGGAELQRLEAELQKAGEEDAILQARLQYPSGQRGGALGRPRQEGHRE